MKKQTHAQAYKQTRNYNLAKNIGKNIVLTSNGNKLQTSVMPNVKFVFTL